VDRDVRPRPAFEARESSSSKVIFPGRPSAASDTRPRHYYTVSHSTRPSEMQENAPRSSPVIVITGTPGTGKTTHAQLLVDQSPVPLKHINVSELIKERMLHDGFDEEWQTYIVDEDKVCSYHHLVGRKNDVS
jgi:type II secretory pathway predicted ATPase ExeA